MEPLPSSSERVIRRSRSRLRVLLALASLSDAYAGQLARMTGLSRDRVRACLLGRLPDYRPSLSLVGAGLARVVLDEHGRRFEITPRGRRKARSLVRRVRVPLWSEAGRVVDLPP